MLKSSIQRATIALKLCQRARMGGAFPPGALCKPRPAIAANDVDLGHFQTGAASEVAFGPVMLPAQELEPKEEPNAPKVDWPVPASVNASVPTCTSKRRARTAPLLTIVKPASLSKATISFSLT